MMLTVFALAVTVTAAQPERPLATLEGVRAAGMEQHIPKNVQPYFLAFFVNPPMLKEMPPELFVRHQDYMRQQVEAGVYRLMGPIADHKHLRGLMIIAAPTIEQARAVVEEDPATREGGLAVEVYPALFPSLSGLRIEYPEKK